jgi:hypothetical protein
MKKSYVVLLVICAVAIAATAVWSATASVLPPTTVDEDVSGIMSDIDGIVNSDSDVKYSSNPFDYAQESPALDRLVAKGTPALPVIESEIRESKESGLDEYLLMIAAMRISKVDVANGPEDSPLQSVQTASEWPEAWQSYVKSVPGRVQDTISSRMSLSEKNRALTALGTPAIPYLLDEVAGGATEFAPAVDQLMQGCVEVNGATDIHVSPSWAEENSEKFNQLRGMSQK